MSHQDGGENSMGQSTCLDALSSIFTNWAYWQSMIAVWQRWSHPEIDDPGAPQPQEAPWKLWSRFSSPHHSNHHFLEESLGKSGFSLPTCCKSCNLLQEALLSEMKPNDTKRYQSNQTIPNITQASGGAIQHAFCRSAKLKSGNFKNGANGESQPVKF